MKKESMISVVLALLVISMNGYTDDLKTEPKTLSKEVNSTLHSFAPESKKVAPVLHGFTPEPIDWFAYIDVTSLLLLFITAIILVWHAKEMRRSTSATAFKAIYDMLQDDKIRAARGVVLYDLKGKNISDWSKEEILQAEIVCQNYDSVAIMVRNGMIKESIIADSWGDSLRNCWERLSPLVMEYRGKRNSNEFWDDFEWLAKKAEKYQQRIHQGRV